MFRPQQVDGHAVRGLPGVSLRRAKGRGQGQRARRVVVEAEAELHGARRRLAGLGAQRVPRAVHGAVAERRERHLDGAHEVVARGEVLVEDGHDERLARGVVGREGEIFAPARREALGLARRRLRLRAGQREGHDGVRRAALREQVLVHDRQALGSYEVDRDAVRRLVRLRFGLEHGRRRRERQVLVPHGHRDCVVPVGRERKGLLPDGRQRLLLALRRPFRARDFDRGDGVAAPALAEQVSVHDGQVPGAQEVDVDAVGRLAGVGLVREWVLASRHRLLLKRSTTLEALARLRYIGLDKTGTSKDTNE